MNQHEQQALSHPEDKHAGIPIHLDGADVQLFPDFITAGSDAWFSALREQIEWRQHQVSLFGKVLNAPRLSAWYGDPEAHYSYSNIRLSPTAWITPLLAIKKSVEAVSGSKFNSVLANLYRNGNDSMGWHADDEPELGVQPMIASLSLGAARRMRWRHKQRQFSAQNLMLPDGSLLLMRGHTQRFWQHSLPKISRLTDERINLTFRFVDAGRIIKTDKR